MGAWVQTIIIIVHVSIILFCSCRSGDHWRVWPTSSCLPQGTWSAPQGCIWRPIVLHLPCATDLCCHPERKRGCGHGLHEAGLYATIDFHYIGEGELGYIGRL